MKLIRFHFEHNKVKIYFLCFAVLSLRYTTQLYYRLIKNRKKRLFCDKIKKCKKTKKKIKVGFLVSEQAKWCYQSVYDAFNKDPKFEPIILVTALYNEHKGRTTYYKTIKDCFNFFKSKGLNVVYAYNDKKKQYIDINKFNLGILFYQQPWELSYCQSPIWASKKSITCYCSYGYELVKSPAMYMEDFHRQLDFMFTESIDVSNMLYKHFNNVCNLMCTGNPKLDSYIMKNHHSTKHTKPIIIYAPHHSFETDGIQCATFNKNGRDILKMAKKYSSTIDWIFKPHPRFKHAVIINNIMSVEEIESYYKEWLKIGKIYEGGDYIPLFKNSDAMITDCVSFLAEYVPSTKPLFHLFNTNTQWNEVGEKIIRTFYKITSINQLNKLIKKVVLDKQDLKQKQRDEITRTLFVKNQKAGNKIYFILSALLKGDC